MARWIALTDNIEDETPDIYDMLLVMFEIWNMGAAELCRSYHASDYLDKVENGKIPDDKLPELIMIELDRVEINNQPIARRIRSIPRLANTPIVMITPYRIREEQIQSILEKDQIDHILFKPLPGMPELCQWLDELIEKRKSRSQ